MLSSVDDAEFAMLRETVKVSDSVLSKHLRQLEDAGYVSLRTATRNGRQRTWAALTAAGRAAFAGHVAELRRLASLSASGTSASGTAVR